MCFDVGGSGGSEIVAPTALVYFILGNNIFTGECINMFIQTNISEPPETLYKHEFILFPSIY